MINCGGKNPLFFCEGGSSSHIYGKQTGSFGYQGIKMGIHSIQTEGDQMRDKLLELLK